MLRHVSSRGVCLQSAAQCGPRIMGFCTRPHECDGVPTKRVCGLVRETFGAGPGRWTTLPNGYATRWKWKTGPPSGRFCPQRSFIATRRALAPTQGINHQAERDLRPLKVVMKIAGGWRTEQGAEVQVKLRAWFSTQIKPKRSPLHAASERFQRRIFGSLS